MIFAFGWVKKQFCKKADQPTFVAKASRKADAHGLVFGYTDSCKHRTYYYAPEGSEGSALILGAPGTGKSSAVLIPSLRSLTESEQGEKGANAYVIDIADELSRNVPQKNKIEYRPSSDTTIKYNVFATVDAKQTEAKKNQELMRLSYLIMPELKNASSNALYFQNGGRDILKAALIAYYDQGLDFPEICRKINRLSYPDLFSEIDKSGNEDAISFINKFERSNEANVSGCKENVESAVQLFATDENVTNAIGRGDNSFSPEDLEKRSVYVIVPDNLLKLFSPLLRIVTAQFLDFFSNRDLNCKKDLIFAIDEFATIGLDGEDILHCLRTMRKRKVKLWIICQSLIDLDVIYNRDVRMAMCDNMLYTVALSCRTVETQRYISDLIGTEEYERESYSGVSVLSKGTKSVSIERRNIIEPTDLANLGDQLIVLYPGGYLQLTKSPYYAD